MRKRNIISSKSVLSMFLLLAVALSSGCSTTLVPPGALYQRLKDRGPVLLSTENPYLPANRLLSEELQSSAALREFISKRGTPTALQVHQGVLERTELSLMYPAEEEVYRLVKRSAGWSIGEPQPLSGAAIEQIEAELALGGMTLGDTRNTERYVAAVLPTDVDSEDSEMDRARLADDFQETVEAPRLRDARRVVTAVIREASVKYSKSKGLIHTVTFSGESLSVLAMWYTGAASNAGAIAKASGTDLKRALKLGQSVNIPPKLLKNKRPLTLTALQRLR